MARFKLVFFAPIADTKTILSGIFKKYPHNVGKIGDYSECAFVSSGTGQFRPGSKTNPTIGHPGELEYVDENKVEVVVNDNGANEEIRGAIEELKKLHPYEEVAYDVFRLEDF
ncbi:hypothetical protein QCA50_005232 [Cerrena zonata]|uniref:ATP phosphoribosyltransferase n=1 Tax=Cerrena zonata TaxID=2478898 RepID=A0AAW0GE87_9APHY